ncbi:MAG: dihydrodipicolinate synthase family protein [Woeseiaceae bacterium]
MNDKVSGVFAAVPTPFDEDYAPIMPLFMEHCEWVIDQGCDGLNVLGSTGEATSQTSKARAGIMRAVATSSLNRGPLMVGTGTPSLGDTVELTTLAAELGFDAALVLPPYYYTAVTDDGLFNYFAAVVDSIKSSAIGIYLYNFPQMTGLKFSTELVARLIESFPGKICGMKDSSGDLEYANHMAANFAGTFDVFPGSEGPLPDAQEFGYAGCISASVNATAKQAANVWRDRADVSSEDAAELRQLRADIQSVPIAAAAKMLTAVRTGQEDWRRMLPPLTQLNADQEQSMQDVAQRLGLSR